MQLRDRELRLVTRVPHDLEVLGDADRIVQVRLRQVINHCGISRMYLNTTGLWVLCAVRIVQVG
jgi:hypothetical protein